MSSIAAIVATTPKGSLVRTADVGSEGNRFCHSMAFGDRAVIAPGSAAIARYIASGKGDLMRIMWTAAGCTSFGLGVVGAVVPLLPTVPFMLLAAFCFARGSDKFHAWLMAHPRFGAAIRDWQASGAISRGAKRAAVGAILASVAISMLLGVPALVLAIQVAVLACVAVFILTRPAAGRPGP